MRQKVKIFSYKFDCRSYYLSWMTGISMAVRRSIQLCARLVEDSMPTDRNVHETQASRCQNSVNNQSKVLFTLEKFNCFNAVMCFLKATLAVEGAACLLLKIGKNTTLLVSTAAVFLMRIRQARFDPVLSANTSWCTDPGSLPEQEITA